MVLPPAYLFVVRHGLRLDVADKQWHLTSPTPYDPPLTYNGWQQAKALGARIGNIIRDGAAEEQATAAKLHGDSAKRRRKKYKVVIHSSPFLRCVQTSIAISAGLAQDPAPFCASSPPERANPSPVLSPHVRPTVIADELDSSASTPKAPPIRKSVLRLDAFLGEWLTPNYYELITPPPESVMMLASAKADLLRRENYASYPNFSTSNHSASQGHLWNPGSRTNSTSTGSAGPLDSMSSLSSSLHRAASLSAAFGSSSRNTSISQSSDSGSYIPPVPHWALHNSNNIPPGYVAHARDACVDIDYQWDSMRHPLDWGDGGMFPEEWTAMHKRFRKGVQHLVDWYSMAEKPTDMVTKTASRFTRKISVDPAEDVANEGDDDVETEAIVIMVSHGAGCNALIGAITHAPVLTDVGMASLTMAVRRTVAEQGEGVSGASNPGRVSTEKRKDATPVHQLYDLKIFASMEHLRSMSSTSGGSRTPSVSVASPTSASRGRVQATYSSLNNFTFHDSSRSSSAHASFNSPQRSESSTYPSSKIAFSVAGASGGGKGGITVGSGVTSFISTKPSTLARTPSLGLWSPVQSSNFEDDEDDEDDNLVLNFSHEKHASTPAASETPVAAAAAGASGNSEAKSTLELLHDGAEEAGAVPESPGPPTSLRDTSADEFPFEFDSVDSPLWDGGPKPLDDADRLRDVTVTKRRWTVNDRG